MRDRRRFESNEIVGRRSLHPQMLPAIVDIDSDSRIAQDVFVRLMEIAGVLEDRAGKVSDVHAFDARVKRGSCGACCRRRSRSPGPAMGASTTTTTAGYARGHACTAGREGAVDDIGMAVRQEASAAAW